MTRAEPKVGGSIFRFNRDTRFSADKSPYKVGFVAGRHARRIHETAPVVAWVVAATEGRR